MNKHKASVRRGFTLIELLVVIAIIAVLTVVVVLTLNPAGLLQQARDSNRISDMGTFKGSLSLYLVNSATPSLGTSTLCYLSIATTTGMTVPTSSNATVATSTCSYWFASAPTSTVVATTTYRLTGGTGWVPVNFNGISAGAPFPQEPIDPLNTNNFYYSYVASTTSNVFKIGMFMESAKYSVSGTADTVSTDGGMDPFVFEGGTNLAL